MQSRVSNHGEWWEWNRTFHIHYQRYSLPKYKTQLSHSQDPSCLCLQNLSRSQHVRPFASNLRLKRRADFPNTAPNRSLRHPRKRAAQNRVPKDTTDYMLQAQPFRRSNLSNFRPKQLAMAGSNNLILVCVVPSCPLPCHTLLHLPL